MASEVKIDKDIKCPPSPHAFILKAKKLEDSAFLSKKNTISDAIRQVMNWFWEGNLQVDTDLVLIIKIIIIHVGTRLGKGSKKHIRKKYGLLPNQGAYIARAVIFVDYIAIQIWSNVPTNIVTFHCQYLLLTNLVSAKI